MKVQALLLSLLCSVAFAVEKEGDDPLQWLRDSIPGEPGVDYPIFNSVQETSFSCEGRVFGGYYADPSMGCQVYHVCLLDPQSESLFPTSFLCPNGTLFQQQIFNCDWWYNVDCSASESFYSLAENAFGTDGGRGAGSGSGAGQCPNVSPLSEAECAGTVSECWSPGQPDTDCPNFGLCCFDGCADTCVDSTSASRPQSQNRPAQPAPQTTPRPAPQTTLRPAPQVTQRPAPQPTLRPESQDEGLPVPQNPTVPAPQPTIRPSSPTPGYNYPVPEVTLGISRPESQTPGYNYPVPEVTLGISRPTTTLPPITPPAALYGAPALGSAGRRGRQGRQKRLSRMLAPQPDF